jgi:predicted alpha/beta hydrolase
MNHQKLKIKCEDGVELSAIILLPDGQPKAVVQINSATATPKEYYLPFANYLVENGFLACVFDYRGVCEFVLHPKKLAYKRLEILVFSERNFQKLFVRMP